MSIASTTSSPLGTIRVIASDIKLAHSVFAMPFALLAAFMATSENEPGARNLDWRRFGTQLAFVVVAMFLARTTAMIANRILDREIDGSNPRTSVRALPGGRVSPTAMFAGFMLSASLFMLVCIGFGLAFGNWWPAVLSVPVLAWISAYALLKRFTWLCHLYLGASLAISPIAAAIAINPDAVIEQPSLWLLSGMVLCWVAGFDIIYALQDVDVDRAQGLHSIPARMGVPRAMWIARFLHALAVACLFACWRLDPRFGVLFVVGVGIVMVLLIYEHLTVSRWGTTKIALAFFTLNGIISCVLGALGIADILW
jgi:4-hydroxybenzoate polyprenyltransferase